jgi:PAS domain S-box-containing protein
MMIHEKVHERILENLSDGVMTIRRDGMIMTFNKAAEKILGLEAEAVIRKPYGDVFFGPVENDDYNQAILDAVYDSTMFHRKLVTYMRKDEVRTLVITSSFLTLNEAEEEKKAAVVVVFDDVTETERLRGSEKTLTEEVDAKHRELAQAYRDIEAKNKDLGSALKKVHMIRIAATASVFLLFISLGFVVWKKSVPSVSLSSGPSRSPGDASSMKTLTVSPQTLTDKITLKGSLHPAKIINVLSPFGGKVKEVFFKYGQSVKKGQVLLAMDSAEVEMRVRDAKVAYIEALENMRKYELWERGDEVARAKRSLTKSTMSLETSKSRFENSEMLYKKGIISKNEYDGDKQSYETVKLDYEEAKEERRRVLAKGTGDDFETARLKLANARQKLAEAEQQLGQAVIYAPVSGTLILSEGTAGQDGKGKTVEKGASFSQGDILISIGDTEGMSVSATVDETEVIKIKGGQEARIAVDAYPDMILQGSVTYVSTQAKGDTGGKSSSFEIAVVSEKPKDDVREKLRLGMSATVDITVLNKPDTIMIPIGAVGSGGIVTVQEKKSKEPRKVKVETGITTPDMVEIRSGLKAGDVIVVPY